MLLNSHLKQPRLNYFSYIPIYRTVHDELSIIEFLKKVSASRSPNNIDDQSSNQNQQQQYELRNRRQTAVIKSKPTAEQRAAWQSGRPLLSKPQYPPPLPPKTKNYVVNDIHNNEFKEQEFKRTQSCPSLPKPRQFRKNALTREQIQDIKSIKKPPITPNKEKSLLAHRRLSVKGKENLIKEEKEEEDDNDREKDKEEEAEYIHKTTCEIKNKIVS